MPNFHDLRGEGAAGRGASGCNFFYGWGEVRGRLVLEAANREAVRLIAVEHLRKAAKHAQAVRVGTIVLRTGTEEGARPETAVLVSSDCMVLAISAPPSRR